MKRIIFLFCIFFGISLSACPLASGYEKPERPPKEVWLELVAGKRAESSESPGELLVFDNKGDLKWTFGGHTIEYSLVQIHDSNHAVYSAPWPRYTGLGVNKQGELEVYAHSKESIDQISWDFVRWSYDVLYK